MGWKYMIRIEDFCDMKKFEDIMKNWAMSTGLATVAVGADGKYISECYNFTEFCIDLTRGSAEGRRRCEKCDREGKGVYSCHAGLVDFGIPITLDDGTVLGSVIGGQVLPEHPDDDAFRKTAGELGISRRLRRLSEFTSLFEPGEVEYARTNRVTLTPGAVPEFKVLALRAPWGEA